jgi:hypothetical protein
MSYQSTDRQSRQRRAGVTKGTLQWESQSRQKKNVPFVIGIHYRPVSFQPIKQPAADDCYGDIEIHPLPYPLIIPTVLLLSGPQERIWTVSIAHENLQATDNRIWRRTAAGSGHEGSKRHILILGYSSTSYDKKKLNSMV